MECQVVVAADLRQIKMPTLEFLIIIKLVQITLLTEKINSIILIVTTESFQTLAPTLSFLEVKLRKKIC